MRIIKQGYEINRDIPEPTDHDGVLKYLERIGRVCYKSEDKITKDSEVKYIQMIRDRKHWAMLEHYIFVLSIDEYVYDELLSLCHPVCSDDDECMLDPDDLELVEKMRYMRLSVYNEGDMYLVSFSATALNYIMETKSFKKNKFAPIFHLVSFMNERFPELMRIPKELQEYVTNFSKDKSIAKLPRFIGVNELKEMDPETRAFHGFASVRFITNRGISHEIIRHRPSSFAQESTRFVNYFSGKTGNEITVIFPHYFDTGMGLASNSLVYDEWKRSCEHSEHAYMKLREYGATPQQARGVLPNDLKTELIMTTRLNEWVHFFDMRADKPAHPQMKELAVPLLKDMIDIDTDIFGHQKWRLDENEEFIRISAREI